MYCTLQTKLQSTQHLLLGIKQHEENNSIFKQGLTAAIKAVKPKTILCYGGKVDFDFGEIEVKYFENAVTERMKQSAKKK